MALTVCYPTILTVTIEPNADHSGGWWAMIRINDRDGFHVGKAKDERSSSRPKIS